jgi:two-component system, sensor histidine kinase PdtaS
MNAQLTYCPGLTAEDVDLLQRIGAGAPITADISRADLLICCQISSDQGLVVYHAEPQSAPSLYRQAQTGRRFSREEQPLTFRALTSGSGGRRQREVLRHGAPVLQDVFPIHNVDGRVIAAMVVETSMIAHERQRRRNQHFRRAVVWLQEMSLRAELSGAETLSRFGQYDGIYLVDHTRTIKYMSGTASNLFRTQGVVIDVIGEPVSVLEPADIQLVEQAFASRSCAEVREEAADGRVWVRKVVPVRAPAAGWLRGWLAYPWHGAARANKRGSISAVLVMVHNATEAVQKQRELNVKSAIIQEVHHRVKNNLQNIAAILRMQARRSNSDQERQHLLEAVNRVLSMSVIHEFLSQDEHRPINLRDLCQRIAGQVVQISSTPDQEVKVQVQGPTIWLPASQATPAALVVNELLLNAVEHGMANRDAGLITIMLNDLGDAIQLVIEDDGAGLPPDFTPERNTGLGLQIVRTLVIDDLKGTLAMVSNQADLVVAGDALATAVNLGTRAMITFPKRSLGVD